MITVILKFQTPGWFCFLSEFIKTGREDSQERGRQTPRPSQFLTMNQIPALIGAPGDMM
uniref:Uncharacterized protein n=1 Tax=Parascaris univalens TaxID=6257 RepID=A0A915A4J3_PARUN